MNRQLLSNLAALVLLVAIGVVGRLNQPELLWNFTPLAAIGLFAGRFIAHRGLAVAVPLAALLISDLAQPSHLSFGVMLTVYGAMTIPVLLGGWLRRNAAETTTLKKAARWATCLVGPSLLFFLTTNFAVWALQSDYPKTLAGLAQCYAAGVPFYRWMLAGDLFYMAVLFGAAALAGVGSLSLASRRAA